MHISESELILNEDGSVYHLRLLPDEVATTIITVGDQNRVEAVSKYFDTLEVQRTYREFITHTGVLNGVRLTVISTGIGTDNVDIVLNELDALHNIDLKHRVVKEEFTPLSFIRIGTSGALQPDLPVDTFLFSAYGLGLDNLLHFYQNQQTNSEIRLQQEIEKQVEGIPPIYLYGCSSKLMDLIGLSGRKGITVSCPGFYGPQSRVLRLGLNYQDLSGLFQRFSTENLRITNFEMETSGIYGLSRLMGHDALSCNAILANRNAGQFSKNPKQTVDQLIRHVLKSLTGKNL